MMPESLTGPSGARHQPHMEFPAAQGHDGKRQPDMALHGLGQIIGFAPGRHREWLSRLLGRRHKPLQGNRCVGLLFDGGLVHNTLDAPDLFGR